jgi:hypothetical protein
VAFPNTSWPTSVDAAETRTDSVDIVYDDDFEYQDEQVRVIQGWLGIDEDLIGDNGNASEGPGGLASPIGSGGVALTLAAKVNYLAGDLLSVGDNYDAAYSEKLSLDYTGLLWTDGGVDAGALLIIPAGALGAAGTAGRLQWDTGTPGLKYDDGAAWQDVGGSAGAGSYLELANNTSQTQGAAPVEDTVGQGPLDGALILGSLTAYFRTVVTPNMTPGTVYVRLYDMGPKAGPPVAPRLVTELSATTNVMQTVEQALTVTAGAVVAGDNKILNSARMYEVTLEVDATITDSAYLGIAGIEVR